MRAANLERSYANRTLILIKLNRLPEARGLLQVSQEICLELDLKPSLGYCYWRWADLDAAEDNQPARKQKLQQALALFTNSTCRGGG